MDGSPAPEVRARSTRITATLGEGSVAELAAFHAFLNPEFVPSAPAPSTPAVSGAWSSAPAGHHSDDETDARRVLETLAEGARSSEELHAALAQSGKFPARALGRLVKSGEVIYKPSSASGVGLYSLSDLGWDKVFESPPQPTRAPTAVPTRSRPLEPMNHRPEVAPPSVPTAPHVYQAWAADICLQDGLAKLGDDAAQREMAEKRRIELEFERKAQARRDRWARQSAGTR